MKAFVEEVEDEGRSSTAVSCYQQSPRGGSGGSGGCFDQCHARARTRAHARPNLAWEPPHPPLPPSIAGFLVSSVGHIERRVGLRNDRIQRGGS